MRTETLIVITEVCESLGVDRRRILGRERGPSREVEARQMSQYILHTLLSWSMSDIADEFMLTRPAIGHSCRAVEDSRSSPTTDDLIHSIEQRVSHLIGDLL